MSDYAELVGLFHNRLLQVPPPENAKIPGARTMIGSREEALHLLWAREYLWQMGSKASKSLGKRWEQYREFWEEKNIEDANSPEWL